MKKRYFVLQNDTDITAVVVSSTRKRLHIDIHTTKFEGVKNIHPSARYIEWVLAHYNDEKEKKKFTFDQHFLP